MLGPCHWYTIKCPVQLVLMQRIKTLYDFVFNFIKHDQLFKENIFPKIHSVFPVV